MSIGTGASSTDLLEAPPRARWSALPAALQTRSKPPLFVPRAHVSNLDQAGRRDYLIREGVPSVETPSEFGPRLAAMREQMGEWAAFVGALAASGITQPHVVADRMDRFEQFLGRLPERLFNGSDAGIDFDGLAVLLEPGFEYSLEKTDGFAVGTEQWARHFPDPVSMTANCIDIAALFALIVALKSQVVTGEGYYFGLRHASACLGIGSVRPKLFEFIDTLDNPGRCTHVIDPQVDYANPSQFLVGSNFVFVSSILLQMAYAVHSYFLFSAKQGEKSLQLFSLGMQLSAAAEQLDPFNPFIYENRRKLFRENGDPAQAQANDLLAREVYKLHFRGNDPCYDLID
ncbi:MAG: hypothetical protein WC901_05505 [Candidatus Margulisiibacteriota bacterium]